MVKHIVLWTFKEGINQEAAFATFQNAFAFAESMPGTVFFKLHRGFAEYDLCMESVFANKAALKTYQDSEEHQRAKAAIKALRENRAACDFEIDEID